MKNCKLLVLPLCFLVLAGCGTKKTGKLDTPVLQLNEERNGLTWASVPGATSYSVNVNDEGAVTVQEPGYEFETIAGAYNVKVVAKANGKASEAAEYNYSTLFTILGDLSVNENVITWASFGGVGLEYFVDDGEPIAVVGNSITASTPGLYTVRALSGFVDESHKYYIDAPNNVSVHERSILVQGAASSGIMLECGDEETDTDLQEKYIAKKYDNNSGWINTTATLVLDSDNQFGTGNCVRANIWHHGAWFKWTNSLSVDGKIESLHFLLKGSSATRFALSFDVTTDLVISGLNLKGVYATYMVQPAPTIWTEYTISTSDPNWTVNYAGTSYPFATVQSMLSSLGYNIESVGDFFPNFGSYSIKAFGEYEDGGPTTRLWFDDVSLGVEPVETKIEQQFDVAAGQYAFKSNQINAGVFKYNPGGQSKVEFRQDNNLVEIPVTTAVSKADHSLTITSTATGLDFVAKLTSDNGGKSFTLVNVTGTAAAYMQGMVAEKCQVLYDFEEFTSTGVGNDQNHTDPTAWSGLRKEFYSDFYNNGSGSTVGGSGWSMMASTDYLELSTSVAHTGSKSMRLKYNKDNQMRFLTYGLATEGGEPYVEGTYLSMWVRANSERDNVIKLKAFYINYVTPSTQTSCTEVEVTVPHDTNNGWVEVKVQLSSSKSYYGFAILPMKNNGAATETEKYFYVDDIAVYSGISPFVNAAAQELTMAKAVRLEDIAKECGVTKGLVSRALAGKYNVGDDTRNAIMQKAVELGYDFNKLRVKNVKKTSVVIIVSSSILTKEIYWQPILKNMYATLNRESIKMEYFVFESNNIDMDSVRALKDNPCIAFVILHKNPDAIYKELLKFNKPIIEVDPKYMHYYGTTQIKYSNYISMYEATQKLIDAGHRHICFYGSDMHALSFRERHEGFLGCIEKNLLSGQNVKGYEVIFDNSDLQYSNNEMLEKALTNNKKITAIVCANDIVALNAYKVIQKMGKSVPNDYSIIGFDNVSMGETANPSLSTYNVPREEIGDEIGLYINRLKQNNKPQYSEVIIRCDYVERNSTKKLEDK